MTNTNRLGCIVLVSNTHGDAYAYPLARSVNTESTPSLIAFAADFASTLALDDGELLNVYLSEQNDPGAARLAGPSERYVGAFSHAGSL